MKMVVAYIRHEAFEPIREELLDAGFPSLSITEVKGSGRQKGITEHYRGSELADPPAAEAQARDASWRTEDLQLIKETILQARPHGLGRRREGVRPAGRGGDPHPHRRGRARPCSRPTRCRGDPGGGLSAPAGPTSKGTDDNRSQWKAGRGDVLRAVEEREHRVRPLLVHGHLRPAEVVRRRQGGAGRGVRGRAWASTARRSPASTGSRSRT